GYLINYLPYLLLAEIVNFYIAKVLVKYVPVGATILDRPVDFCLRFLCSNPMERQYRKTQHQKNLGIMQLCDAHISIKGSWCILSGFCLEINQSGCEITILFSVCSAATIP